MAKRILIVEDEEAVRELEKFILEAEGYEVTLSREHLAGEDDDEDHPWAVVTDAPPVRLELLVESHDGWFDADDPSTDTPAAPRPPLDLPDAPRRIKRPDHRAEDRPTA